MKYINHLENIGGLYRKQDSETKAERVATAKTVIRRSFLTAVKINCGNMNKILANMTALVFVLLLFIDKSRAQNGPEAFVVHKIVPDVIPNVPSQKLEVMYPQGISLDYGIRLPLYISLWQPTLSFDQASDDDLYTLIMIGADPLTLTMAGSQFLHWIISNIPGGRFDEGNTDVSYFPPGLPNIPSPYPYVYLLYRQQDRIEVENKFLLNLREGFHIDKFVEKYNLDGPVAGNFHRAVVFI